MFRIKKASESKLTNSMHFPRSKFFQIFSTLLIEKMKTNRVPGEFKRSEEGGVMVFTIDDHQVTVGPGDLPERMSVFGCAKQWMLLYGS